MAGKTKIKDKVGDSPQPLASALASSSALTSTFSLSLTIDIDPIPKARMTRYGKNSRRARRTLSYQEALAWEVRNCVIRSLGNSRNDPKAQSGNNQQLTNHQLTSHQISLSPNDLITQLGNSPKLELSATFQVTHNRRADLDNYLKALKDALKWAGIIKDDSQIIAYGPCKLVRLALSKVEGKAPKGSVSITLRIINPVPTQVNGNANGISQK